MDKNGKVKPNFSFKHMLMIILVAGSFWGFSEVVLNEIIRDIGLLPLRAAILLGMGMLAMGFLMGILKKPSLLPIAALITILLKQLAVPLAGASFPCKANSCIAVLLQASILAGFSFLLLNGRKSKRASRIAAGAGSGILSAALFLPIGLRVAPCTYLFSYGHANGFLSFMAHEGVFWALFGAALFPAGYWLGEKLESSLFHLAHKKPVLYYSYSGGYTALCWVAITFTIMATAG